MKRILLSSSVLDVIEKISFSIVFLIFTIRVVTDVMHDGSVVNFIYLFDQSLIFIFLILRRGTQSITKSTFDWLLGVVGTFIPLLIVTVEKSGGVSTTLAGLVMLTGILIHLSAKLILRRSFGVVAANRGVKIEGPYRLVRHPMYLGYMILQLGFLLAGWNVQNFAIIITCWILFFYRIAAEEKILSQDPCYQALMLRVRYRLIPGVY